jgi:hypothetical protein
VVVSLVCAPSATTLIAANASAAMGSFFMF